MKYCKHCDKTFAEGYKQCPYCKRPLKQSYEAHCPHCNAVINDLSKPYCSHCGMAITIPGMRVENPVERLKRPRPGFFQFLILIFMALQIAFAFLPMYLLRDGSTNEVVAKISGWDAILYFFTGECAFYDLLGGGGDLQRVILLLAIFTMANLVFSLLLLIFDLFSMGMSRGRISRRATNMCVWSCFSLVMVVLSFLLTVYLSRYYRESGYTVGSFGNFYLAIIWLVGTVVMAFLLILIRATKLVRKRDRIL